MDMKMLNQEEKDVLQEMVNISFGSATAIIADMMNAFANLAVPSVDVVDAEDLFDIIVNKLDPNEKYFFVTQTYLGSFEGETIFIIDYDSAYNLGSKFDEIVIEENISDLTLELTNILTSSFIRNFAELMGTKVRFSPPSIELVTPDTIIKNQDFPNHYSKVIVISTLLEFKEENIKGFLFILMKEESFRLLKEKINSMLEQYNE